MNEPQSWCHFNISKQSELPWTAETCCVIDQLEAQIQTLRNLAIAYSTFAVEQ